MLMKLGLGPQHSLTILLELPHLVNFVSAQFCPLTALEDVSVLWFCFYMPSLLQYEIPRSELRVCDVV